MALDNAALLGVLEAMRAAGVEDRVRGFAQPLGYACATTETVVELDLLSADIIPVQPPEGSTRWLPTSTVFPNTSVRRSVCSRGIVNAEAPQRHPAVAPNPVSAEEYGAKIGLWQQQGRTAVESIALASSTSHASE